MEGWYVAKVKPQKEGSLQTFLQQWDVEVFYPTISQPGGKGNGKPLFPTYLFCRLDPVSQVWPVARWAPGMAYFLSQDGVPTQVPDQIVEFLRLRVNDWNDRGARRYLKLGAKIVVLDGPFSGMEGIFQRYVPSRERCQILLEAVGRLGRIEIPEWEIKEVSEDTRPSLVVA